MGDQMRDDWATVVSLAEGLSERPRAAKNAGERLWAGIEALRARVAELEVERRPVDVEYGVRYATGTTHKALGRHEARYTTKVVDGAVVVERDVYAPGPWREVSS